MPLRNCFYEYVNSSITIGIFFVHNRQTTRSKLFLTDEDQMVVTFLLKKRTSMKLPASSILILTMYVKRGQNHTMASNAFLSKKTFCQLSEFWFILHTTAQGYIWETQLAQNKIVMALFLALFFSYFSRTVSKMAAVYNSCTHIYIVKT